MTDKIILFLVEGPTDEDTLALIYSKIVKDHDIKFEVLHTDITADEEMTVKYIEVRIKKAVDFEDFEGTVKGSVKEESGIEYLFELCAANQYSTNLELPPGNYQLCTEAIEKDCRYRVLYDVAEITLKESELKVENLRVLEERVGTIRESEVLKNPDNDNMMQTEQMKTEKVSKEVLKRIGKWGILVVLISLAGYLLIRKKKQTYT